MSQKKVWMVIEHYTPYKHNNCTENDNITIFENFHTAVEFIRGTDGNGTLNRYEDRVKIALRAGMHPEYAIGSAVGGLHFKVKDECVDKTQLEQGGTVCEVVLAEMEVRF